MHVGSLAGGIHIHGKLSAEIHELHPGRHQPESSGGGRHSDAHLAGDTTRLPSGNDFQFGGAFHQQGGAAEKLNLGETVVQPKMTGWEGSRRRWASADRREMPRPASAQGLRSLAPCVPPRRAARKSRVGRVRERNGPSSFPQEATRRRRRPDAASVKNAKPGMSQERGRCASETDGDCHGCSGCSLIGPFAECDVQVRVPAEKTAGLGIGEKKRL